MMPHDWPDPPGWDPTPCCGSTLGDLRALLALVLVRVGWWR